MGVEFRLDLVVVDAHTRFFRGPRRNGKENDERKSQGTRKDAKSASWVNQHLGESPRNDNPFPMMKILTQKMVEAQDRLSEPACRRPNRSAGTLPAVARPSRPRFRRWQHTPLASDAPLTTFGLSP